MRALWLVPLLVTMLATAASAQQITLKDLVHATIKSTVWRARTHQREGKKYSGKIQSNVKIDFGNLGDPLQFTRTSTWFGSNGRTFTTTVSGSGLPGKPRVVPGSGGGHGVGFLQNGTIYFMRTFKSGAFKFEFKLSRTSKGLICVSRETYLKERGAGAIRLRSNATGRSLVIVSDRQIRSTCRVIRR